MGIFLTFLNWLLECRRLLLLRCVTAYVFDKKAVNFVKRELHGNYDIHLL